MSPPENIGIAEYTSPTKKTARFSKLHTKNRVACQDTARCLKQAHFCGKTGDIPFDMEDCRNIGAIKAYLSCL
jgi:hypothetical protein